MASKILICLFILLFIFTPNVVAARPPLKHLTRAEVNIQQEGDRPPRVLGPQKLLRPGPKPKPLEQREYHPHGVIRKVRRTYSREKKIDVLMFLTHHRVPANIHETEYRRPNFNEAGKYFKISASTIKQWWHAKDQIVGSVGGSRQGEQKKWVCAWPELEQELFNLFLKKRLAGELVRRGWFRRTARQLFNKLYDADPHLFVFSNSWFQLFCRRWNISLRALTKKSSRLPDEYRALVINWLRFNRRNSQPRNSLEHDQLISDVGPYQFSNILNLDETPIPFEYLDGKTYDIKGSKTVNGKSDRSGWDKRQATLILYIFADGISRIKPKLIFHALSGASIRKAEEHLWNSGVTVEFNPTAYNNENLFTKFIDEELVPALNPCSNGHLSRSMLIMDAAQFHITDGILSKLRSLNILTSLIPGGCTGLLQPLDVAVNKPFKEYLRDFTDAYLEEHTSLSESGRNKQWSVSDKRVMTTHVVADAWKQFCNDKRELVVKSFSDLGVTLPIDGSKDHLIRIKGFNGNDLQRELLDWKTDVPLPLSLRKDSDYRALPNETTDHNSLEFVWQCEDYFHVPPGPSENTVEAMGPSEGTLIVL